MIYQFRGGLREDLQLALVLVEPTQFDQFYNMALKQEGAQLKCEASKKRIRDAVQSSSSSQVAAKQQKFYLPPLHFVRLTSRRTQVVVDLPTHPTQAIRTSLSLKLQGQMLLIIVRSQK